MLFQGKADKVYIRKRILKAGLDKNGYFWNKDALESLVRDFHEANKVKEGDKWVYVCAPEGKYPVNIFKESLHLIGHILDVMVEGEYLVAVIAIDKKLLASVGVKESDVGALKFGGCVKVSYDLTGADVCDLLAFDDVDEEYAVVEMKEGKQITVDSPDAHNMMIYVDGKKQGFVTSIKKEGDWHTVTLTLPNNMVEVRLKKI